MRIRPRPHFVYARPTMLPTTLSPQGIGFVQLPPSRPKLPHEFPEMIQKRLIAFLKGSHPVPHPSLETILPRSEALAAREEFITLVKRGLSPGEAVVELGIVDNQKEWHNVPNVSTATIIEEGCDCIGAVGTVALVASSAGEPFGDGYRIYQCSEFLAVIDPDCPEVVLAA